MEYATVIYHGKNSVLRVSDHYTIEHDVVCIPFKVFVVRDKSKSLTNCRLQGKP